MIFKTITNETSLSSQKIVSVLQARKIAQEKVTRSIQEHIVQLELDKMALTSLEQKIKSGMAYEEAYSQSMNKASIAAKEYVIQTQGIAGTTDTFVAKQKLVQAELESTTISTKIASAHITALRTAFNMFSGIVIMVGITKIIEGFEYLSRSAERAKEKLAKIQTELYNNSSSYESNRKTLLELQDEYDTLTKKAEKLGGIQNLANEEYKRYQEITSQILGITPKLITGWNNEGIAISNKNNLLQSSIDLLDEEYEKSLRNNTTKSKNETVASGVIAKVEEFENRTDTKTYSNTKYKLVQKDFWKFINEAAKKGIIEYTYKESGFTSHGSNAAAYAINEFIYGDDLYESTKYNYAFGWIGSFMNRILSSEENFKKFTESLNDRNNPIYQWLTDEQIDTLILDADDYYKECQRIIDDRETLFQEYKDQLNWNAKAARDKSGTNAYKQLSDNGKTFINEYIEGLDYSLIKSEDDFVKMAYNVQELTRLLASDNEFAKIIEDVFAPKKEKETLEDYVKRVKDAIDNIHIYCKENSIRIPIDISDRKQTVNNLETQYQDAINFTNNKFSGYNSALFFKEHSIDTQEEINSWLEIAKKANNVAEAEQNYINYAIPEPVLLSEDKINLIDEYRNKLKELYAALNLLHTDKMTPSDMYELIKNFPVLSGYVDNLDEGIEKLITDTYKSLKMAFNGLVGEENLRNFATLSVMQESVTNSIEASINAIDNITSSYQTLNQAVNEYNENGYLSLETLERILKLEPQYLSSIINEDGSLKNVTEVYKTLIDLKLKDLKISARKKANLAQVQLREEYSGKLTDEYGRPNKEYTNKSDAIQMALEQETGFIDSLYANLDKMAEALSSSVPPTSDFEQKIDLASQSITTLQQNLSSLQNALSDVSGYKNQIEAIDNIIKAQGNLYTGYEHSRDLYQKQYENSLNNGILAKHGLSKLVKEKIESGAPFFTEDSIEKDIKFGNISITQQDYENIKDAISWYNKVLEAEENLTKTKSEIDKSKMSKYDVLRKKSEAYIDTLKNSQKRITDTIDFNGNKATEEQYNNLILYQMGIRKVLEDRYKYESSLLETLTPETDQYTEQEKIIRECEDGLAECDKNIKDWRLDMLRLELEAIDDEIDSINDKIKANQDEIDEKDKLISGAIGILNQEVKVQEGLRDVIQERIDALQEENDEHERALALEKAKYELQRAYSQRTVKLYSGEERGFIYTQDREAVRDAQENLDKLEYEETIHALQEQVGYYDDIIDNLNTIKDSWSNISSAAQEFLEIESVIAKYGVGIKDSILSGSYDTDGLTQSYKGLLHLGEEFDNDLKKQEDLRSDLEKSIEQFQNGAITLEQCLTDIGTLLGKVYDISKSTIQ